MSFNNWSNVDNKTTLISLHLTRLNLNRRWRGSIYKLVWLDLATFLFVYYILNIWYRVIMTDEEKRWASRRFALIRVFIHLLLRKTHVLFLQDLWGNHQVLCHVHEFNSPVVRPWLLRHHRNEPLVGPVHHHPLAWPHCRFCQRQRPWPGEAFHYQFPVTTPTIYH